MVYICNVCLIGALRKSLKRFPNPSFVVRCCERLTSILKKIVLYDIRIPLDILFFSFDTVDIIRWLMKEGN